MRLPAWMRRRRFASGLAIAGLSLATLAMTKAAEQHNWLGTDEPSKKTAPKQPAPCPEPATPDPLLGPRTKKPGSWVGRSPVQSNLPIVVMAGHADSQGTASPGTPGFAVDQQKRPPMQPGIRDELFWNREVQAAVVSQGQARGLNIRAYTPPSISIANDDDPSTNWSKAKVFSERGEYVLEIHFDAYRPHGFGSGLIPVLPNVRELNVVDESLAQAFGRYPRLFRGGLGGPRRGIGILEIAMLEPPLETKLRDPRSREHTVNCLAERVVNALVQGVS